MKKTNNFFKYIRRWLIVNNSKFIYKPYLIKDLKNRGYYFLKFSSIPNITVYIKPDGSFDMWVMLKFNNKEYHDNLLDISTNIKQDYKGFYCGLCTKKVYYRNKVKIWQEHFKEFLDWINNNLKSQNQFILTIYGECNSSPYDIKIVNSNTSKLDYLSGRIFYFPLC